MANVEHIDFDEGEGSMLEGGSVPVFKFWHWSLIGLVAAIIFRKQLGRILKGLTK